MSLTPSNARAWLEIMRISNAPTVVSNAIAGGALGLSAKSGTSGLDPLDARWIIVLAPLCCYIGGMVLNDAFDARIDARERPERPIPSGRISRSAAFVVGALLLLGGIAFAAATGSMLATLATAVLAIAVLAYDAAHSHTAASIVLLAICRALAAIIPMAVFAAGAQTIASSGILVHPAALALWTLLLSHLARWEIAEPHRERPACPSCGHALLDGAPVCSECGRKPNRAITETRVLQRHLVRTTALLLLFTGVVTAFILALSFQPTNARAALADRHGLSMSVVLALLLVTLLLRGVHRLSAGLSTMPRFVGSLIAMLAAIDCLALTIIETPYAFACAACFVATLLLQRRIAGS